VLTVANSAILVSDSYVPVLSALKTLWLLSVLDNSKRLTKMGRQMALFPLDPTHARSLFASHEHGCTPQVLSIISVLSTSSKLFIDVSEQRESAAEARRVFAHVRGDHLTVLNVIRAYEDMSRGSGRIDREAQGWEAECVEEVKKKAMGKTKAERKEWCRRYWVNERTLIEAREIRKQLQGICERLGWTENLQDSGGGSEQQEESILLSLGSGLVQNSAFLQPDGSYKQTMGYSNVKVHPGSVLAGRRVPAIVYDELVSCSLVFRTLIETGNNRFIPIRYMLEEYLPYHVVSLQRTVP
jgi:HrpA-like RNA helicase